MAMKTNLVVGVGGCCIILAISAAIPPDQVRALPVGNAFQFKPLTEARGFVSESSQPTQQSVSVRSIFAPRAGTSTGWVDEPFKPVLLRDMQRPLSDNEVWIAQALLLNATEGTLACPGRWAAPAKLLRSDEHWK
jgi:hypothetical protein